MRHPYSGYGQDDRAIVVRSERIFPLASVSRPALGPTQPPGQWVPGFLSSGIKRGRRVTTTTHTHLVRKSRMSRSYTPLPPSAFMACSGTALAINMRHPSNGSTAQIGPWPPSLSLLITQNYTHGRTPLDEWSARLRGLYLHRTTQHINIRDKHPCPGRDSNPTIPATKRPHNYAL
jgi:hypothetical protein